MADQIYFEDVVVGSELATTTVIVSTVQMFFFSAATYNGHRIHYDRPFAAEHEGHPDVLVHGPLQAALMAKTLTDWAGLAGRLVRLAVQNRASAYPGEELRFTGRVTGKVEDNAGGLIYLEVQEEKGLGELLMPATATVRLPKRTREPSSVK